MKTIVVMALVLSFANIKGQIDTTRAKSIFYNEKGQLIADTNYKISKGQMDKFIPVEKYLKKYIEDYISYPEQAKDNHDTGYVIVSFRIGTTDTLQEITVEKAYEKNNYLSKEVKRIFKKIHIPESAYSKQLSNKKYFLAVSFVIVGLKYKHPGCIRVITYDAHLGEN